VLRVQNIASQALCYIIFGNPLFQISEKGTGKNQITGGKKTGM